MRPRRFEAITGSSAIASWRQRWATSGSGMDAELRPGSVDDPEEARAIVEARPDERDEAVHPERRPLPVELELDVPARRREPDPRPLGSALAEGGVVGVERVGLERQGADQQEGRSHGLRL